MNKINHIGIIPDGGRRWAKENKMDLTYSYNLSFKLLLEYIEAFIQLDIKNISIYLGSKDNYLKRNSEELIALDNSLVIFISNLNSIVSKYSIKVKRIGTLDLSQYEIHSLLKKTIKETKDNNKIGLNLLIGYDPFDEINSSLTKDVHINNLSVKEKVDIIIRTGDANTLSNFLPLQSGYARLYFLNKLFNDVVYSDIDLILKEFVSLGLKYGE